MWIVFLELVLHECQSSWFSSSVNSEKRGKIIIRKIEDFIEFLFFLFMISSFISLAVFWWKILMVDHCSGCRQGVMRWLKLWLFKVYMQLLYMVAVVSVKGSLLYVILEMALLIFWYIFILLQSTYGHSKILL